MTKESHQETILAEETLYPGRILDLMRYRVELPDGRQTHREIVRHHGGAAILAIDPDDRICFVRQFRLAAGKELLELPAGKLEKGEDPLECAERELREETGFLAAKWEKLGAFLPSPGYTSEILHLYLAEELTSGRQALDEGEFLDAFRLPYDEVMRQIDQGEIEDGKTLIALLLYRCRRLQQRMSHES